MSSHVPHIFTRGLDAAMKHYAVILEESISIGDGIVPVGKLVILITTFLAWVFVATIVRYLSLQDLKAEPRLNSFLCYRSTIHMDKSWPLLP